MITLPNTIQLTDMAKRVIWFRPPEDAIAHPFELITYAMQYASAEDMHFLITVIGKDGLREAIDHAVPGVISPRSWAYWNLVVGRMQPPPPPVRFIP